jgi:hypothetical protein
VSHADDRSQVLHVEPPLERDEVELLSGLAGAERVVRRLGPGQPGPRSPWVPCESGCCLVPEERKGVDPVVWLRFLVKEVLAPQARDARARASRSGLPGGHRLDGRVLLSGDRQSRQLTVAGRQVRVRSAEGGGGADRSRDN